MEKSENKNERTICGWFLLRRSQGFDMTSEKSSYENIEKPLNPILGAKEAFFDTSG